MNKTILASLLCFGLAVTAQAREVQTLDLAGFQDLTPEAMDATKVYFTYTTDPGAFDQWNPVEAEHLALWKGYAEPAIPLKNSPKAPVKKLTVFISRTKAVLNKPASSINFANFVNPDLAYIKSLNTELQHQVVPANQILPAISGKGPVRTFNWCNQNGEQPFTRAMREGVLEYLNPPADVRGPWCANTERSICIESCYTFDYGWQQGVSFANNTMVAPDDQKDLGVATQSEVQYFTSEEELGRSTPVSQLTGVNGKVAGVLRQNIFYVNQALQFGTVTAFFQEFPGDPNRTVVTSYVVFTIGTDTFNGYKGILREVLMGRAKELNTPVGITAGLPEFTKATAVSITSFLEK